MGENSISFETCKEIVRPHQRYIINFPHFIFTLAFGEFFFQSFIGLIVLTISEIFKRKEKMVLSHLKIIGSFFSQISLGSLVYSNIFFSKE